MTEANKDIVRRFNDGITSFFQGGDLAFADLIDPAATIAVPGMPTDVEGLKQVLPAFRAALSEFQMTVSNMVADGDLVAYEALWTAKHTGELMGIPPSGNTISVSETHVERVHDGKIVEHRGNWDQMGMMQQMGAIPTP
ncbi:MAG: ester cyclase [Dehalococcoidia bacterium]